MLHAIDPESGSIQTWTLSHNQAELGVLMMMCLLTHTHTRELACAMASCHIWVTYTDDKSCLLQMQMQTSYQQKELSDGVSWKLGESEENLPSVAL